MIQRTPFFCPQRFQLLKSLASSILILVLGFNLNVYAEPSLTLSTSSLEIPAHLGMIQTKVAGNSKKVILIQDAHDSLVAQENIAAMIHHLVAHYKVRTVFEEGFEGPVPTDELFGFIADAELRRKVSYFFLDRLRIGGAEYAHINRTKDFKLIGADNVSLHLQNITHYRNHLTQQNSVSQQLTKIQKELKKIANLNFPTQLKMWLKLKEQYAKGDLSVDVYLKRLLSMHASQGVKLRFEDYPHTARLLASFTHAQNAREQLLEEFHLAALLKEIGVLEDSLAKLYLKKSDHHELFNYLIYFERLQRLNHFEVIGEEYLELRQKPLEGQTKAVSQFILKQLSAPVVFSKAWETDLLEAFNFYQVAELRHEALRSKLSWFQNQKDEKVAIVVYGGFHRAGIESILEDFGFSYAVVNPSIPTLQTKHQTYYDRLMGGEQFHFEVNPALATAARVLTLPEKRAFLGTQRVQLEINQILQIVKSLKPELEQALLIRAIEEELAESLAEGDVSETIDSTPSARRLPYVADQTHLQTEPQTVFMHAQDFLSLTPGQQKSFEVLGHWFSLKYVFYGGEKKAGLLRKQAFTHLQENLGSHQVVLSSENMQTALKRHSGRGVNVHLSKGRAETLRKQLADIYSFASDLYLFEYLGNEETLLGIALRYASSGLKALSAQVLDITRVNSVVAAEVRRFQANLVFASHA